MYSRKGRTEAEAIRAKVLEDVENPQMRENLLEESEIFDDRIPFDGYRKRNLEESKEGDKADELDDFEFGPKHGRVEQPSNSKKDMLSYLQNKSEVILFRNLKNSYSFYEVQLTL